MVLLVVDTQKLITGRYAECISVEEMIERMREL